MFSMFFGFNGRINRSTWWIAQIVMFACSCTLNYFTNSKTEEWKALTKTAKPSPEEAFALLGSMGNWLILMLVFFVLSTWIFLSTGIQRLHDRGCAGWRILFAYVPMLCLFASVYVLLTQGAWGAAGMLVIMGVAGFVVSFIWQIVELGCFPSEDGENEYGLPPGAASRLDSLQSEIAAMSGGQSRLQSGRDEVYADVRQPVAAAQTQVPRSSFGKAGGTPAFGKR